jgi:hypothetical protein
MSWTASLSRGREVDAETGLSLRGDERLINAVHTINSAGQISAPSRGFVISTHPRATQ